MKHSCSLALAGCCLFLSAVGAAPPAAAQERTVVPIVLDVTSGASRFTTELSLANPGSSAVTVALRYTAALGAALGSGTVFETIPAGGQVRFADAIATLRSKGLTIPTTGPQGGTLVVESPGTAIVATARTTTPIASPAGRAGLAYGALGDADAFEGSATVFGLRTNAADRSNVAVFSTSEEGVTLRVTAFDGESGAGAVVDAARTLPPYGWHQYDEVLRTAGFSTGWVVVERVGGTGSFSAYGVVNDNGTGDGSFVPPARFAATGSALVLPVLVEAGAFLSELVLANGGSEDATFSLTYVESLSPESGAGGTVTIDVPAGRQRIFPDALEDLRRRGLAIGPKGTGHAGSVRVLVSGVALDKVFVAARTASQAPGRGQFGVFTPAVPAGAGAATEAIVYGLGADALNRTNVAVLHAGDAGSGPVTLRLQVHDGAAGGAAAGSPLDVTLERGEWAQPDGFFAASGVANGFVRATHLEGNAPWIAYGVVNDGGSPGERTGDGAFVPAVVPAAPATEGAFVVDHTCTDLSRVPARYLEAAKAQLKIGYGHTSHGSQIVTGMEALAAAPGSLLDFDSSWGYQPGVFLNDSAFPGANDLGSPDRTEWADATRALLNRAGGCDRNVVVWSWCGQADTGDPNDIETYLSLMSQLETEFPGVRFVYMTGHLVGSGAEGDLHLRNEQIRRFCRENGKVLFDFADIESYDPGGLVDFMRKYATDGCEYDRNGDGNPWGDGNWAQEWVAAHPAHELTRLAAGCGDCAHSERLNCVLKARAFWWMLARLAGWDGVSP
ncbi:MAG: hypothetical protein ACYDBY_01770 [Thermoanaerobaculia bacterium]